MAPRKKNREASICGWCGFNLTGGDSGPAIVPGEPDASHLLERIRAGEMPPGEGKVTPKEIDTIARWIAAGAKTARPEPESIAPGLGITAEERSLVGVSTDSPPRADSATPTRSARSARRSMRCCARPCRQGLTFSADADQLTLITRAYFDLLGLAADAGRSRAVSGRRFADAYEQLIDRLARLAALRRTLGPALARRRRLCR